MQANHSRNQNRKAAEVLLNRLESKLRPGVRTLHQNSSNNKSCRNTRRSEHFIWSLFLQLLRTQTKPIKFIWHSRLLAQLVKTLQETITFANKRKSLLVIQIQEALWRKLNKLKPLFSPKKSVKFASDGQSCRPETNPTENQYACHDLSVWNKLVKSKLRTLQSIIYPPEGKNLTFKHSS